jgi:hypothetical protein
MLTSWFYYFFLGGEEENVVSLPIMSDPVGADPCVCPSGWWQG